MGGRDKNAVLRGGVGRGSRVARGKGRTRLVGAARGRLRVGMGRRAGRCMRAVWCGRCL